MRLGEDFGLFRQDNDLVLDGPGGLDVLIVEHFGVGRIEKIKFANAVITGAQAASLAREAAPEERLPEDETSTEREE